MAAWFAAVVDLPAERREAVLDETHDPDLAREVRDLVDAARKSDSTRFLGEQLSDTAEPLRDDPTQHTE